MGEGEGVGANIPNGDKRFSSGTVCQIDFKEVYIYTGYSTGIVKN